MDAKHREEGLREEIEGALARGYCTKENESKVLDPTLIKAMADQITPIVARLKAENEGYKNLIAARCRIHRIGQTKKCTYVHLIAEGTIDKDIYDVLQRKGDMNELVYKLRCGR